MPANGPPPTCPGRPRPLVLTAGSRVFRVHDASRTAHAPDPVARPDATAGGRFDSLDGSHGYLYVAPTPGAAIAETLTRELPFDGSPRLLPRAALTGRALSELAVDTDLVTTSLVGPDVTHVGQDAWLTTCSPAEYVMTRRWAAAIQAWTSTQGLSYLTRHDLTQVVAVLFTPLGTLLQPGLRPIGAPLALDSPEGVLVVRRELARHNATVARF